MGNFTSALLYFYIFMITMINLSMAFADTTPNNLSQSRALTCSQKSVDNKNTLTCSEHTQIPKPNPSGFHFYPEEVKILDMSNNGNHIQTLKTNEFENFINIIILKLQSCQIRTIENHAFSDLEFVQEIDLRNNNIDSLNMEMIGHNPELQILRLSGNPIHQFIGSQFPSLEKLKLIDLSSCSISKIPVDAFKLLGFLQELDLRSNKIRRLDWKTFDNVNMLHRILLDNNEWECDCHMYFLQTFLGERKINISKSVVCRTPDKFANVTLSTILQEELTCHPLITAITPIGDATQGDSDSGDLIIYSEIGNDIGLDCAVDAYPEPEISWLKDNRAINDKNRLRSSENLPESENKTETALDFKVMDTSTANEANVKFRYQFRSHLTIYNTSKDDVGDYECVVTNVAGRTKQKSSLNITNIPVVDKVEIAGPRESRTWLWIMIAVLAVLFIALLVTCILIWRKRDKQRQLKYRGEMLNKFKGSEIVIDDAFAAPKTHENSSTAPLLSNANVNGITVSSTLPDVAQGGTGEQVPSLSPVLFSPRPQTSELRKHFFAMQEQPDRPSRPGSSMSLVYYGPPSGRQFTGQGYPQFYNTRPQDYRMTQFGMRKPWGSSQSLVHPMESSYGGRPLLTRQFSGPAYSTTRLPAREWRPPNAMASEPFRHNDRARSGIGYVTLPRNFPNSIPTADSGFGPSVSPTESSYSTFSYRSSAPARRFHPNSSVIYDSVGPRTTADGGSNLSLNKLVSGSDTKIDALSSINLGLASPTKGKINPGGRSRSGSSTTPGSLRGKNDFFSFEPIQEVEGNYEVDLASQPTSNTDSDPVLPKLQIYPQTQEAKYKKKKPPPMSAIPQRSRKPIRTFEYSKLDGSNDYDFDASLDGDNTDEGSEKVPNLPISPRPRATRLKSNIEDIIEEVEGTEV